MKTIVTLMLVAICSLQAIAQSVDSELENKYFLARNRLKKWFVTAGKQPGNGLLTDNIKFYPQSWEMEGYGFNHYYRKPNGTDSLINSSAWNSNLSTNKEYTDIIGFSQFDNPLIMAGQYLQLLSTEYWLLKYYGKTGTEEFTACKNEMYYVLQALDRLDGSAEKYFKPLAPTSQFNGFLRRDDSDWDRGNLINNYYGFFGRKLGDIPVMKMNNTAGIMPDTTYMGLAEQIRHIWVPHLVPYIDSANNITAADSFFEDMGHDSIITVTDSGQVYYKNNYKINYETNAHPLRKDGLENHGSGRRSNEPSIDEYVGLFIGLKYVQKFVDEGATAKPLITDSSKYLVQWTRDIAHRMMTYLTKQVNDIPLFEPFAAPSDARFNIPLFKKGNYVLYNPMRSDSVVSRGLNAFIFGKALEKLGEELASSPSQKRNYDSTTLEFSSQAKKLILAGKLTARFSKSPLLNFSVIVSSMFDDTNTSLADEIEFLRSNCNFNTTEIINVDKVCNCLVDMRAKPEKAEFWDSLWSKLGNRHSKLNRLWRRFHKNAGSVNIMAAKMAAASGTWNQTDFAVFASACGFPLMSFDYDILNDKTPYYSEAQMKTVLQTLDCQGSSGIGWPFDRDAISGAHMKPSRRGLDLTYDGTLYSQTPYMIYYNLYRIAKIKNWGDTVKHYSDESCPCFVDSFKAGTRLPVSAIEPTKKTIEKSGMHSKVIKIKEHMVLQGDTIGRFVDSVIQVNETWNEDYYYYDRNKKQTTQFVKTKDANPSHALAGIRQPEILNHNYKVVVTDSNQGQTFQVTRDLVVCGATLNIDSGGTVRIDTSANIKSLNEVIVRRNGLIDIHKAGIFYVNNNTRLVINDGGTLYYRKGARIILNGPNAVLHVKGTLQLEAGATFTIEGGPAGKGYIIWENGGGSPHFGSGTLLAGPGSKLELYQTNKSQTALVCTGGWGMWLPPQLVSVKIHDCKIVLQENSRVVSRAQNLRMDHVTIKGFYDPHPNNEFNYRLCSGGLHIIDNPATLNDVTVYRCATGITSFTEGGHKPLILNNVKIQNCLKGLVNNGNRVHFKNGEVLAFPESNSHGVNLWQLEKGIEGTGLQGTSMFENVTIEIPYGKSGAFASPHQITGSINADYLSAGRHYFYKCSLNNATECVRANQGWLLATCTWFEKNITQVSMWNKATLNAINGYNSFTFEYGNTTPPTITSDHLFFRGRNNTFLYLQNGNNYISAHNYGSYQFINASIDATQAKAVSNTPTAINNTAIVASGNEWAISYGNGNTLLAAPAAQHNYSLWDQRPPGALFDINRIPYFSNTAGWLNTRNNYCTNLGSIWPFSALPVQMDTMKLILISKGGMSNNEADGEKTAVQDLYDNVYHYNPTDYTGNTADFKDILTRQWPDTLAEQLHAIYGDFQSYYYEVFADTLLTDSARNAIIPDLYEASVDLQETLINRAENEEDIWYNYRFELHRDMALIHRAFHNYSEGIDHITDILTEFTDTAELHALHAWKCLLTREKLYIDSLIPYDSMQLRPVCLCEYDVPVEDTFNYTEWEDEESVAPLVTDKTTTRNPTRDSILSQIQIYPNPAQTEVFISSTEKMTRVLVSDATGRQVLEYPLPAVRHGSVPVQNLARGIYTLRIQTEKGEKRAVLVLE
ncbi:MAG: T9SS type A sorting domain-containing protein [Bacteroidetes bacterium]|nr:T9SS type A sorting domain-containing protein [Bacteroidota bacterium]